jgi:hypothetical protein
MKYKLKELDKMPTLSIGQADDLKIYNTKRLNKVWLSRMAIEDGMPYNNQVTIERYNPEAGRWVIVEQYEAI